MKKSNTTIKVSEEMLQLSPAALKSGIERRMKAAQDKTRVRKMTTILSVFTVVLVMTGVVAWAATSSRQAESTEKATVSAQPIEPVIQMVQADDTWAISDAERELVLKVVMSTARGENRLTMQAVAQAIRNSCETFEMTVEEVIAQHKWPVSCEDEPSLAAEEAVQRIVDGEYAVDAMIFWACNVNEAQCSWHGSTENIEFICQFGELCFYA